MAFPRIGGAGVGLGLGPQPSNAILLTAGSVYTIPAGTYLVAPGAYTSVQWLDPVSTIWRSINSDQSLQSLVVDSDGANVRLANLSGCPIGAKITNIGAGYTNGIGTAATGLTITPSAGGSTWVPVVGGGINTTVTITSGGSGYQYAPILLVSAPPPGGLQATARCTVAAGAINSVVVSSPGAGYRSAPTITVVNDARDSTGGGAVLTVNPTLTGSGSLLGLYPSNNGTSLSAVPTFTFSPASTTAATAIMNFVVTDVTVTGGGVAVPAGSYLMAFPLLSAGGTAAAGTAGFIHADGMSVGRPALLFPTISGGVIQAGQTNVMDAGGGFQAAPAIGLVSSTGVAPTTGINCACTFGGLNDTSWLQPI